MKLHQLRIFESVAKHLNVTYAAEELHLSQPAVSLQLKQLELEYGSKFYESNNHGVKLTARGQAFLDAIRPALAQLAKVDLAFKETGSAKPFDILTVGANHTLSVTILPEILMAFKKGHPDVQLTLETANSGTIEGWIENSQVDIALIIGRTSLPHCVYEAYQEQENETVAFVPSNSPLSPQSMSLEELTKHPLVVRRGSSFIEELRKRGFRLKLGLQCHAPDAIKMAVQNGLGVGLAFKSWVQSEVANGDLRLIDVPELKNITYKSFIIYDRRRTLSPSAQAFLRTLRDMRGTARAAT